MTTFDKWQLATTTRRERPPQFRRGSLAKQIDDGWRFFWARRGKTLPPPIASTHISK